MPSSASLFWHICDGMKRPALYKNFWQDTISIKILISYDWNKIAKKSNLRVIVLCILIGFVCSYRRTSQHYMYPPPPPPPNTHTHTQSMHRLLASLHHKAYLHDTICRIQLSFWRMTTSAYATFFAHWLTAKFETWHLYACLFDHMRQC